MDLIKTFAIESLGVVGSLFKPSADEQADDLTSKKKGITYGNKIQAKKSRKSENSLQIKQRTCQTTLVDEK